MALTPSAALVSDSEILLNRLLALAMADGLTPERLVAITARLRAHVIELGEMIEEEPQITPLPLIAMRFHGRFGVIDGGRSS